MFADISALRRSDAGSVVVYSLSLRVLIVWPTYCFLHFLQVIKYMMLEEEQEMESRF